MLTINNQEFGRPEFHNGEAIYHGVSLSEEAVNTIEMMFEDNRDITNLIFAVHYIRDKTPKANIELIMMYIPYSRMDREIPEGNQLFSMKYFAQILADLKINKVYVLDPHSHVSTDLFKEYGVKYLEFNVTEYISEAISKFKADYLFFPDKGACSKYVDLIHNTANNISLDYFYGTKRRDLANKGKIIEDEYELHDVPSNIKGTNILIVDDLVSLGGTAYIAGKKLKEAGAGKVALYISHCENGIFVGKLLKPEEDTGKYVIDHVYTAGTIPLTSRDEHLTEVG